MLYKKQVHQKLLICNTFLLTPICCTDKQVFMGHHVPVTCGC